MCHCLSLSTYYNTDESLTSYITDSQIRHYNHKYAQIRQLADLTINSSSFEILVHC